MRLIENFTTSLDALRMHWLRTILTCFGVALGVTAVLSLISFYEGQGAEQQSVQRMFMGADKVTVGAQSERGRQAFSRLDLATVEDLGEGLSLFSSVELQLMTRTTLKRGRRQTGGQQSFMFGGGASVSGISHRLPAIEAGEDWDVEKIERLVERFMGRGRRQRFSSSDLTQMLTDNAYAWILAEGELFSKEDVAEEKLVCLINKQAKEALFDAEEKAVGEKIQIGGHRFEVVGAFKGGRWMPSAFVPATTFRRLVRGGAEPTVNLLLRVKDERDYRKATEQLEKAVQSIAGFRAEFEVDPESRWGHRGGGSSASKGPLIRPEEKEVDFAINGEPGQAMRVAKETHQRALKASLGGGVALLIALIGLSNMLLVSVSERTREIGVRRAVGAFRSDIVSQFLIEGVLVAAAGALFGAVIGYVAAHLLAVFVEVPTFVPPFWVIVSIGTAILASLILSFIPAFRAGLMEPVRALRWE